MAILLSRLLGFGKALAWKNRGVLISRWTNVVLGDGALTLEVVVIFPFQRNSKDELKENWPNFTTDHL